MWWPASICLFSVLSRHPRSWFLTKSRIQQVSNIFSFLSSCAWSTSYAGLSGRASFFLLAIERSHEEEYLVRAKNFSAHNPTVFSFFPINVSSKESKSPEAHPRISFLTYSFLMTCAIPLKYSSLGGFFFFVRWSGVKWKFSSYGNLDCNNFFFQSQLFSWRLGSSAKKFDCDNCSSWRKARKTKRNCWQVRFFGV